MLIPLTDDEQMYCDSLERLVTDVAPVDRVQKMDHEKKFDDELHDALSSIGAWGIGVSDELGGVGGGPAMQVLTLECLGRHATSMAVFGVVQYMATRLLQQFGSPAQQDAYLTGLCTGEMRASFCLTEADGGTDILSAMKTRAAKDGDQWVLNGSKYWISGAMRSDLLIVLARTAEHRSHGISMFLVPKSTPGVNATELDTFAINSYDTCSVTFDDVKLPADALLGIENAGFKHVLGTLNSERLNASAVAAGIGRGAHRLAVQYALERNAFGHPIGRFQALQHKLVHAGVDLEAAWTMTLSAARREEQGHEVSVESAMAKLACSKAGQQAAQTGMEIMGGAAFDIDYPMQRYYRDIRLYSFAPLTDAMTANFLGERWLGLPRSY